MAATNKTPLKRFVAVPASPENRKWLARRNQEIMKTEAEIIAAYRELEEAKAFRKAIMEERADILKQLDIIDKRRVEAVDRVEVARKKLFLLSE